MMASLMCHSQVIKAPQEIYDVFSYRKFGLARSRRSPPAPLSFFGDKEEGTREKGGMNPSALP